MKIGYPTINLGLGVTSSHTFRLASLSEEKLYETIRLNLSSLQRTLEWNVAHRLLFFRISSNLIPFASHPQMSLPWQDAFRQDFAAIGDYIRTHTMRISMHPGQYVVINSPSDTTFRNSVAELQYHADILNLLGLDSTAKFQIHLGGLHGNATQSIGTFIERYNALPDDIRSHLVIENDERAASLADCMSIHEACGIPVLFDTLHHEVNNNGETIMKALKAAASTWQPEKDGNPMIDYSSQNYDKKTGAHAITLDVDKFRRFISGLRGLDIDIMFEIKNKEASALQAQIVIANM